MRDIINKYKLKDDITNEDLKNCGFRNNKLRVDIHCGLIYLIVTVEIDEDENENSWWTYQVCNEDCATPYAAYYNRLFGKNELVEKLDKRIDNAFSKMKNIFTTNTDEKENK